MSVCFQIFQILKSLFSKLPCEDLMCHVFKKYVMTFLIARFFAIPFSDLTPLCFQEPEGCFLAPPNPVKFLFAPGQVGLRRA